MSSNIPAILTPSRSILTTLQTIFTILFDNFDQSPHGAFEARITTLPNNFWVFQSLHYSLKVKVFQLSSQNPSLPFLSLIPLDILPHNIYIVIKPVQEQTKYIYINFNTLLETSIDIILRNILCFLHLFEFGRSAGGVRFRAAIPLLATKDNKLIY